jgi:4-hydroxy-2-oxoheptanedioate aldolase
VLTANQEVLTWAMIETAESIEHLEDIVTVPGLDGIYIGPSDLSMELEGKVSNPLSHRIVEDIHRVITRARARRENLKIGVFCPDTGFALEMAQAGCNLLTIMNDVGLLRLATSRVLAEMAAAPQGSLSSPDSTSPAPRGKARP